MQAEKKRQKTEIEKEKEEYEQLHRKVIGLKRKAIPSDTRMIDQLQEENRRLKAENKKLLQAQKSKEIEIHEEFLQTQRLRETEIRRKFEVQKGKLEESQTQVQVLEEQLAETMIQLEQEQDTVRNLQKEIDHISGIHQRATTRAVELGSAWQLKAEEEQAVTEMWRRKYQQTRQLINESVPTFADTFESAERVMTIFNTPHEIRSFMELSHQIVKKWKDICKREL